MKIAGASIFFLLSLVLPISGPAHENTSVRPTGVGLSAFVSQESERPDIEWFRKELGISTKYTEHENGPVGLSWAHFLTMVFLILSFVAAVIVAFLRYRRTKELLTLIMKEGSQNDRKG